jgi:uncharacterized short protein YbdD (DUF466 family)
MEPLQNSFRQIWQWLRAVSGDDAYERYLAHHHNCHPDNTPLDRRAFFLREQQRKWGKLNRCC